MLATLNPRCSVSWRRNAFLYVRHRSLNLNVIILFLHDFLKSWNQKRWPFCANVDHRRWWRHRAAVTSGFISWINVGLGRRRRSREAIRIQPRSWYSPWPALLVPNGTLTGFAGLFFESTLTSCVLSKLFLDRQIITRQLLWVQFYHQVLNWITWHSWKRWCNNAKNNCFRGMIPPPPPPLNSCFYHG